MNLFNAMPMAIAEEVSKMVTESPQIKGSFIYLTDDPATTIYFLKEGRVKVSCNSKDGREMIKAIIYPGELFGELKIVDNSPHRDFAEALDDVLICSIPINKLTELMIKMPDLGMAVNASIGRKMLKLERRFESLVFKDARTRIIEFIIGMANEHGSQNGSGIALKHNLTHQDIANLVATSRQTVTTLLNELKEEGILKIERKRIIIKSLAMLEASKLNSLAN